MHFLNLASLMSKEQFQALCEREKGIPLFLRYDWISTVAKDEDWGVLFSGDPGAPKGFLVYFMKRKFGVKKITHPPLTPYLGPWIFYPEGQKQAQRYGHEKKVMDELIEQLPPHHDLVLNFHPSINNWLPFYWKGFNEQVRYTYRSEAFQDSHARFKSFSGKVRTDIRKAEKILTINSSDRIDPLHELQVKAFNTKGIRLPYDQAYFQRIDEMLAPKKERKILYTLDEKGNTIGGIYLVMDQKTCYYLIGALDPEVKSQGSMSLLIWKGIEEAMDQGLSFDFEGSMIEPIERFFRGFGAEQMPYHSIGRTPSPLLRMKKALSYSVSGA